MQRKRADCGIASPVIAALCGQNANRQSEQERGGDSDYALGHHGSPLGFRGDLACIAAYSTAACDGRHEFGEYSAIVRNYSRMHLNVFHLRVSLLLPTARQTPQVELPAKSAFYVSAVT